MVIIKIIKIFIFIITICHYIFNVIKQKIILTLLTITLSIYVFHDLLPYHNHGITHFHDQCKQSQITNAVNHGDPCDGHDLCLTCQFKINHQFHHNHQEIDFNITPVTFKTKLETVKVPRNLCKHLYQNDHAFIIKSKYIKLPHSLRAPPFVS